MKIPDHNPNVTVKLFLESRVTRKNKKHPLKFRITFQRKQKYYVVKGLSYTSDEFNQIMSPDARGKNKDARLKLSAIETHVQSIVDDLGTRFSFEAFSNEFGTRKTKNITIQDLFENKAKERESIGKLKTAILYRTTINSLLKYDPKITFQKITPQYLVKYEKWMLLEDNSVSTVGIYLRNLRAIVNQAMEMKLIDEYPFGADKRKYSIPRSKNTKKALTLKDISKLIFYDPASKNERLALNYFLFSYLCNGMNMADIANLKFKNIENGNIKFIRQKTKDTSSEVTTISILMQPAIEKIIELIGNKDKASDNFIFPIYKNGLTLEEKLRILQQRIKHTNKYIKQIAKKVEVNPNITTYWARHSYSTILKRSGAPIEFISEQLGHQDIRTTRSYLDTFEDDQRAKYSAVLIPQLGSENVEG